MVLQMGVIVESNAETFDAFSEDLKITRFRKNTSDECDTSIGKWLNFDVETGVIKNRSPKFPSVIVDGVLHLNSVACCANQMLLEPEIREKWEKVVWSPFVGEIYDSDDCFSPLSANELHNVTVKYVGFNSESEDCLWELVSCGLPVENLKMQLLAAQAPWTLNQIELEIEETAKRDISDTAIVMSKSDQKNKFCGLAVYKDDKTNLTWLWGHSTGKIQLLRNENADLGQWYLFCLKNYNKPTPRQRNANGNVATFAINLQNIEARSKVVEISNNEVGVVTEFTLDENVMNNTFYWDYVLGKVEFSNRMLEQILKLTNTSRTDCASQKYKIVGIAVILKYALPFTEMIWSFSVIDEVYDSSGQQIY